MIADYEMVSEHDLALFKTKVNEMIAEGWQPYGNLVVSQTMFQYSVVSLYTQAMVKHGNAAI